MYSIRRKAFEKRIVDLCVRSKIWAFPQKRLDQLILLKSIVLTLNDQEYTEKMINQKLQLWLESVGIHVDYVSLRRRLVDEGFLCRDTRGTHYQVQNPDWVQPIFEADVDNGITRGRVLFFARIK